MHAMNPVSKITAITHSADETRRLAAEFAQRLVPGDVVLLSGDLGAGKTTFVRGACELLGVAGPVTSPSYVFGNIYEGRVTVAHLDLYRLESVEFSDELALDDYLSDDRVGFVEWPHDGPMPDGEPRARVTIEHAGGDDRRITVEWRG
jgi:tRNA threonylcarbamoyladenosine biosynthesis protein TsaE